MDVSREADHPALLGQRPQRRLADPERRVGREPEPSFGIEALDGARQPEGALLQQVLAVQAAEPVALRDAHDEAQVRLG